MRFGPIAVFFLNHPDHVQHVLRGNQRNFGRSEHITNLLLPFAGSGLLTLDGEAWLRRRRLTQPAFHREAIGAMGQMMFDPISALLERWTGLEHDGAELDLAEEMLDLSLRITLRVLCSAPLDHHSASIRQAALDGGEYFAYRSRRLIAPPLWVPTARNLRFRGARAVLVRLIGKMIEARRARPSQRRDLLDMLLEVKDQGSGQSLNTEQACDEMIGMLVAGHETTASALTWALYLLAQNPAEASTLRAELRAVLDGRMPTAGDLPRLPYTRKVVEESLRLYPPAWAFARTAIEQDRIGGYRVPPGMGINILPYTLHRNPTFWPDPDRFDPERFEPERSAGRHPFAYIPFGGGPHKCIGHGLAMMEVMIALAAITQQFHPRLVSAPPAQPEPLYTLRPLGGMKIRLERADRLGDAAPKRARRPAASSSSQRSRRLYRS